MLRCLFLPRVCQSVLQRGRHAISVHKSPQKLHKTSIMIEFATFLRQIALKSAGEIADRMTRTPDFGVAAKLQFV